MSEEKRIDHDWKEQAQREKERLSRELDAKGAGGSGTPQRPGAGRARRAPEGEGGGGSAPAPGFLEFVNGLAAQVMLHLGMVPDPYSGQRAVDLEAARYQIDVLGMLVEKTRGNLSPQESRALNSALAELRMGYVEVSQALARQAGGASGGSPGQ